jgi:hypothetical protein
VLTEARSVLPPDDPAVETVAGLITPETIAEGEPIRAVDALLAVDQLCEALTYANRFNEGPAIG